MKTENILQLTKAGFTADQLKELDEYNIEDIQSLIDGNMSTEDIMKTLPVLAKVNPPAPPTPTNPNPDNSGVGEEGNKTPAPNDPINVLTDELKSLRAAIQASNINAGATKANPTLTVEDVAKEFFNGPNNKGDQNNGK